MHKRHSTLLIHFRFPIWLALTSLTSIPAMADDILYIHQQGNDNSVNIESQSTLTITGELQQYGSGNEVNIHNPPDETKITTRITGDNNHLYGYGEGGYLFELEVDIKGSSNVIHLEGYPEEKQFKLETDANHQNISIQYY